MEYLQERQILNACALRFDGYKYQEEKSYDQRAATENFFECGQWELEPFEKLTTFFLLQRGLNNGICSMKRKIANITWHLVYFSRVC